MSTNLSDCDAPSGGFDRQDPTLVIDNVAYDGTAGVVQLQSDSTTTRTQPALLATWTAPVDNPYIVGVQFSWAPTTGDGEVLYSAPQPPSAEAWKTSNGIVGGKTYQVSVRAVGPAGTYGDWSDPEDVTIAPDYGPYVGEGEPAFEAPIGATYQRTDSSQQWRRIEDAASVPSAVNNAATNLASPTNTVTLSGFTTDQVIRFSKPSVANSGGLLTWDAYSLVSSDSWPGTGGLTWQNTLWIYGNNGGADVLLFNLPRVDFATAAQALAALQAVMPFTATGYTTYKIVGYDDTPGPAADNRGGVSLLVEQLTAGWVLMSDLSAISVNGSVVDAAMTSLNIAGGVVSGSTDGAGNVTVTVNSDTDGALAANSDAKVATQKAVKTYVDGKVAGLSWKQAVRAATTVAGTLASSFESGDAIDGVTLATGDRILIKNQATASQNGIYTVNASGAPTRATDADSGAELVNATVYVSEGSTLADTQWTCTTNATITLGSTSLAFAQSGGGAVSDFIDLGDVPASYTGAASKVVAVKADESGLEFVPPSAGGGINAFYPAFTTPIDGNFAWINQGGASVTVNGNGGIYLFLPKTSGTQIRLRKMAVPGSTPWTVTACLLPDITMSGAGCGVLLRESSTGKIITLQLDKAASTSQFVINTFTGITGAGGAAVLAGKTSDDIFAAPLWLQVSDDGVNRIWRFSRNGYNFITLFSGSRTATLTGDEVGFFGYETSNTLDSGVTLLSWAVT